MPGLPSRWNPEVAMRENLVIGSDVVIGEVSGRYFLQPFEY